VARDKGDEFLRTWKILPVSSLPRDFKTVRVLAKPLQLCTTQALGASMWKYPPASEKSKGGGIGLAAAPQHSDSSGFVTVVSVPTWEKGRPSTPRGVPRCGEKILIRGTLLSLIFDMSKNLATPLHQPWKNLQHNMKKTKENRYHGQVFIFNVFLLLQQSESSRHGSDSGDQRSVGSVLRL
jgi:hypothetical protein